jgi:hypothetical protein
MFERLLGGYRSVFPLKFARIRGESPGPNKTGKGGLALLEVLF